MDVIRTSPLLANIVNLMDLIFLECDHLQAFLNLVSPLTLQ